MKKSIFCLLMLGSHIIFSGGAGSVLEREDRFGQHEVASDDETMYVGNMEQFLQGSRQANLRNYDFHYLPDDMGGILPSVQEVTGAFKAKNCLALWTEKWKSMHDAYLNSELRKSENVRAASEAWMSLTKIVLTDSHINNSARKSIYSAMKKSQDDMRRLESGVER